MYKTFSIYFKDRLSQGKWRHMPHFLLWLPFATNCSSLVGNIAEKGIS